MHGNGALACLQRGYRADAALIPEPSSSVLTVAQVGVMWFQVKVTGHPVHVYKADAGSNAIESAFRLIQQLRELEKKWNEKKAHDTLLRSPSPGELQCRQDRRRRLGELGAVLVHLRHARGRAAVADPEGVPPGDRACDPHRGGQRSVPGQQPADRDLGRFQAEPFVLKNHEQVRVVLAEAHKTVWGKELEDKTSTGTADNRFFGLYAGIPALVYGPQSDDTSQPLLGGGGVEGQKKSCCGFFSGPPC